MKKIKFLTASVVTCALFIYVGCFCLFSRSMGQIALTISSQTSNSVTVAWPDIPATIGFVLQTNNSLIFPNWNTYGGIVSNIRGSNIATISPATGLEFFRLASNSILTSPAGIPGLAYYWNYQDLPANSQINTWTDEVQQTVLRYNNGGTGNGVFPLTTNTFPGLDIPKFGTAIAFTAGLSSFSSNSTIWIVMRPFSEFASPNEAIFGDGSLHGLNLSTNTLTANWGSGPISSSLKMNYLNTAIFPYGQTYDILDSGGTLYSNGVAMPLGLGQPTNNFPFAAIGSANLNNGYSAEGFIQYIGIWTNHLLAATDAKNLDNWYWGYGVTNITNGLIAWWKLNDGAGTTAADSWGTNTMYFGGTGNMWTNDTVANGKALYFSGSGWLTNVNPAFADNLQVMTVSTWVKGTAISGNNVTGSLVEKGVFAGYIAGDPGWALQGDGSSNIYFGTYDLPGDIDETPHNMSAPDYPIIGDSNWHFLVGEYTNTTGAGMVPAIYIDGALIRGNEVKFGTVGNVSCLNAPITIGAENVGTNILGSPWGIMSDVRIYNRVLSMQEVQDLYRWRGQP